MLPLKCAAPPYCVWFGNKTFDFALSIYTYNNDPKIYWIGNLGCALWRAHNSSSLCTAIHPFLYMNSKHSSAYKQMDKVLHYYYIQSLDAYKRPTNLNRYNTQSMLWAAVVDGSFMCHKYRRVRSMYWFWQLNPLKVL